MKKRKEIFVIILLISLLSGCSNWNENPVKVEEAIPSDPPGLIYKANFPERTNVIYFKNDNIWFVGTSDGKFYKTGDKGATWYKTGVTEPEGKVNCILYYEDYYKKSYLFAGTEKGIYQSQDLGESWQISGNNLANKYPEINCMNFGFDYTLASNIVYAYGWDFKNSEFRSTDFGKSWSASPLINNYIKTYYANLYSLKNMINQSVLRTCKFYGINKNGNSVIMSYIDGMSNGSYYLSEQINNILPGIGRTIFALSEKCLYVLTDEDISTNKWKKIFDIEANILTLLQLSSTNLFIGTSYGTYITINYGITWNRLYFEDEKDTAIKIYNYKNKLYFVNSAGKVYFSDYSPEILSYVFAAKNITPSNGMELESKNIKLIWEEEQASSYNYSVQISTDSNFNAGNTTQYNFLRGTEYKADGLKPGNKYYWRVRAGNLFGFSEWSDFSSFRVK